MALEEKQPVIQSVFDRRLQEQNESFFLKALNELRSYKLELAQVDSRNPVYQETIGNDEQKIESHKDLIRNLNASENIVLGVLNSFDVLSQDSIF